ncbi:transactivating tegument protein VP16 [Ateline alphaherpesvirus 1]|uniref:Alpha trans-inducing protein n=1 Tax=Herpesvirus ateles type 1 (strain Lennette) TaxID=35243 RepID=A0A1S6JLL2_HSVA1|nr:transactivating tegument protein VP16 [Ateline alphaherpesvirus 1]AQS79168.1 transactivating tegument protein VP16 [Ateline alphaherpesvirus 1]
MDRDQVMDEFFGERRTEGGSRADGDVEPSERFDFDESLLPPPGAAGLGQPLIVPPPSMPAPPATLFRRLLEDLGFSDGPAILTTLDSWNLDLFSCLPHNAEMYADNPFFSTYPSDVIAHGDAFVANPAPIDLRARGPVPLPPPPAEAEGLPAYHRAVERFFRGELRAREQQYARMLDNFCLALYRYLRAGVRQQQRRGLPGARRRDPQRMLHVAVAERYYREAARMARVLCLHMYLTLAREVSWALYADQVLRQDLFRRLRYDLPQQRQLTCLFHPFLFQHGSLTIAGSPVSPELLRTVNYTREQLGLPQIRSAAVEEAGRELTQAPVLRGDRARASGYFTTLVRHKLDAYSSLHMSESERVQSEHAYARRAGRHVNYGSSIEGTLLSPGGDQDEPDGPPPAPGISLAPADPGDPAGAPGAPASGTRAPAAPERDDLDDLDLDLDVDMDLGEEGVRALEDFDLDLLGEPPEGGAAGRTNREPAAPSADRARYRAPGFEVLDDMDLEFERIFSDSLGPSE